MNHLEISVPHNLSREDAAGRTKHLLYGLQIRNKGMIKQVSEYWRGNECNFVIASKGFTISGNIYVGKYAIQVEGNLPWFFTFHKIAITEAVKNQLNILLLKRGVVCAN